MVKMKTFFISNNCVSFLSAVLVRNKVIYSLQKEIRQATMVTGPHQQKICRSCVKKKINLWSRDQCICFFSLVVGVFQKRCTTNTNNTKTINNIYVRESCSLSNDAVVGVVVVGAVVCGCCLDVLAMLEGVLVAIVVVVVDVGNKVAGMAVSAGVVVGVVAEQEGQQRTEHQHCSRHHQSAICSVDILHSCAGKTSSDFDRIQLPQVSV